MVPEIQNTEIFSISTSEEGKSATCDEAATIEEAISTVHWNQLD